MRRPVDGRHYACFCLGFGKAAGATLRVARKAKERNTPNSSVPHGTGSLWSGLPRSASERRGSPVHPSVSITKWGNCMKLPQLARHHRRPFGNAQCGNRPWRLAVHGWQFHASRARSLKNRDHILLPALSPNHRALLRAQSGPHAGSWLAAIEEMGEVATAATTLSLEAMQVALRTASAPPNCLRALWPSTRLQNASRKTR